MYEGCMEWSKYTIDVGSMLLSLNPSAFLTIVDVTSPTRFIRYTRFVSNQAGADARVERRVASRSICSSKHM